jgi:hypothetical protein
MARMAIVPALGSRRGLARSSGCRSRFAPERRIIGKVRAIPFRVLQVRAIPFLVLQVRVCVDGMAAIVEHYMQAS